MQPLAGIRVLSVTVYLAGPFAAMNLARLGAEVIKVEIPWPRRPRARQWPLRRAEGTHARRNSDEDISTRFLKRTQGVKSITLDLKTERGKALFLELAKQSDVVLKTWPPAPFAALGWATKKCRPSTPASSTLLSPATGRRGHTRTSPPTTRRSRA